MDYKSTLNLPKTNFSMKADLPKKEPLALERWERGGLYGRILKARSGRPKYILHDGPPYSNGDIHIGHSLNKILKDIIVKYRTMRGYYSCYVPGWDCHGLPVEHQLFKELGIAKNQIGQVEFRRKAHDYALRYVEIQKSQFIRLGIFGEWDRPYLTLDKGYEADIVRSFGDLVKNGYIYKGLKPVNWCYSCETALAEAEVEYEDHVSPSVYVKFKLKDSKDHYFIIWTTTPWTLMANTAVAVHPEHEYSFIRSKDEIWVMMKDLTAASMKKIGITGYEVIKTARGSELEGVILRHPFIERDSIVVLADYVSNLEGTGCVHTAPGHGQEDYLTGLKYKLPVIMPVDEKGNFDNCCGEFSGIHVYKANELIIEKLKSMGALVLRENVSHSYPHCWRCKNPVIFRATPQWFMSIDHKTLRAHMLEVIAKKIKWVPASGRERISGMVTNRPDWCLSRQRLWGVPIIAFYCRQCGKELLDPKIIGHIAAIFETDGADAWFIKSEGELLPSSVRCRHCGAKEFRKETDIIDVWFDSGVSHQAVLKRRKELSYPCDLYLEGSDQHRGWFQSSLIAAMGIDGISPFKTVLTHGFVVDGEGKKMSKSVGNVVSPLDVIKDYGADILRLWVASSDYTEDVRISGQILTRLADAYRKIRNTYRFILGNLYDFDPEKDAVRPNDMLEVDRWALSEANKLLESVTGFYEEFSFHNVFHNVYDFCVIQLSSFYLDILKDRLYIFGTKSIERRSGQTALFEILNVITRVLAPILVFTTEEVWESLYSDKDGSSVHLSEWPSSNQGLLKVTGDKALDEKWPALIKVREEVLKALELKRETGQIGSSLEAAVWLYSPDKALQGLLKKNMAILPSIFIVSKAEVKEAEFGEAVIFGGLPLFLKIEKAPGAKCQRCWNYSEYVGKDSVHPTLCERCVNILKGENK
ncbi:MAG: isoleucine--tRNA ligase [Candidatus Omnitrophica bacterium]|nr:isoleucine--tRNA ligase [Candidatus Omnitrophota bacterium]